MLYLAAYVAFLAYTASDGWTGAFYTFIFGSGTLAAIMMRRWHKKQDEILNTSLTGQSRLRPQEVTVLPEGVVAYLHERALIIASLLARGASEIYLANSDETRALAEVVTRQTQNGFLRDRGLWRKLEQSEFELASIADGQWTAMQQNQVIEWCEQLRLLRWVLRIDADIVPLAHFPKLEFSLAAQLFRDRDAVRHGQTVEPWEVRTERDAALEYGARIVAEMKARGHIQDDPDVACWADEFRAKSLGSSTDYLAGAKTIADLREDELRLLGSLAVAPERYASCLADQLNSGHAFAFSTWQRNQPANS
jgi:hypothetical protein